MANLNLSNFELLFQSGKSFSITEEQYQKDVGYVSSEIVVTDKRVYGKTYFGRQVDLPLDSISAVTSHLLKGISISTSSGFISFGCIKNSREIHEKIRALLIARQNNDQPEHESINALTQNDVDELIKYKKLFDAGIIGQEEFEAKKKQLLGL